MCRAVTCLSYCIAVTTKSLVFAAEAYPKLEAPLRLLDLVSLRVRRGTLRTNPAVSLEYLSLDVWDSVRYELIELELDKAEERLGASLLCADCLEEGREQVPARKLTWELYPGRPGCDFCRDLAADYEGIANHAIYWTVVDKMLRPFCLRMSTDVLVRNEFGGSGFPENDPDTAVLVTTAPVSDGSERDMSTIHSGDMDICYEQTVIEIEPLRRPDDADARFAAFVSRFHLEPVDIFDKPRRQTQNEQKEADPASKHVVLDARGSTREARRDSFAEASSSRHGGSSQATLANGGSFIGVNASVVVRYVHRCATLAPTLPLCLLRLTSFPKLAALRWLLRHAAKRSSTSSVLAPPSSARRTRTYRMCRATTHVFFGLPLSTSSLVPAADAWPKLVKTLPFFDLIKLRIFNGTFQAARKDNAGPSAVERVPVEVWDVLKHKLVDLELQEANDGLMREIDVNEWSCWGSGLRKPGKSLAASALPPFWTDICSEAEPCDMCREGLFTLWDEVARIERFERLQSLLSTFDLFAPSKQPLMPCDDRWWDPQSATYVASLSEKDACTSLETNCACDSEPDEQRIIKIDFSAMQTSTRQARQRFLRLIRLLHLEPLRIATSVVSKNVHSGGHRRDVTRLERSFTVLPAESIEPKWLALTVSVTDW
ncbi:Proteophosphoglycan ppg4 [Rhodotorula toruloides ATCC 204091]|uniref:Proteophosphoglycan ppg4 n=1 Tax=Rhodotorula toruloides TaxID=5286 RepID=A0A0K3C423_RHOTO|nr:Proteophosphoglycan ppg4 [Rhodotorula toruloides ATCC 204091]PRQ77486.1 Proteophosphoglycan ppg4 [Rhodotorula toruloides]